jgi:hypothetical protein
VCGLPSGFCMPTLSFLLRASVFETTHSKASGTKCSSKPAMKHHIKIKSFAALTPLTPLSTTEIARNRFVNNAWIVHL